MSVGELLLISPTGQKMTVFMDPQQNYHGDWVNASLIYGHEVRIRVTVSNVESRGHTFQRDISLYTFSKNFTRINYTDPLRVFYDIDDSILLTGCGFILRLSPDLEDIKPLRE